jgi:hypothetical protein
MLWEEPTEGIRPAVSMANLMDKKIHAGMKEWPSQHWAAKKLWDLNEGCVKNWPEEWAPKTVSDEVGQLCVQRLEKMIDAMSDLNFSQEQITRKWCEITSMPLLNRIHSIEKELV